MKWIRERVLKGELMAGTFLNLGSSLTAEIAGLAGFDWLLIDNEHGAGDLHELLFQLQGIESTPAAPVVRIAWNDPVRFKRVLDLGVSGVMVPFINTAAEARQAVAAMRYPPLGIRGVAKMNRACGFGTRFDTYFNSASQNLLTIVQIETEAAVENAAEIAAVDGVDTLFVGPLDLSVSLGVPGQSAHPKFRTAVEHVVAACHKARKAAGIVVSRPEEIGKAIGDGFTMIILGSDGAMVADTMRQVSTAFAAHKKNRP